MRKKSRQISNLRGSGRDAPQTATPTQREARQRAKRAMMTPPPAERGDARESSARAGEPTGRQTQSSRAVGLTVRDARRGWHLHAQRSWGGWEGACQNQRGCTASAPSSGPGLLYASAPTSQPKLLYASAPTPHQKLLYELAPTPQRKLLYTSAQTPQPKAPLCVGANHDHCSSTRRRQPHTKKLLYTLAPTFSFSTVGVPDNLGGRFGSFSGVVEEQWR